MTPSFEKIIESIQQLPASEQEKVLQWLESLRTANPAKEANGERAEKSLRWLADNREKYLGQWVALDGDRLICSGRTAKEVYAKAKAEGIKIPFVELVVEAEPIPYSGGWL